MLSHAKNFTEQPDDNWLADARAVFCKFSDTEPEPKPPAYRPQLPPDGVRLGDWLAFKTYADTLPAELYDAAENKFASITIKSGAIEAGAWVRDWTNPVENPPFRHIDKMNFDDDQIVELSKTFFLLQQADIRVAKMLGRKFKVKSEPQIRRQIRKDIRTSGELIALQLGLVGADLEESVSNFGVLGREAQLYRWNEWQKYAHVKNPETGEKFKMTVIAEMGRKRREAELYAFLIGIQKLAEESGLKWMMITLTAPPKYHAKPANLNSSWDMRLTPLDSHKFIHRKWRLINKEFDRQDIQISGVHSAEPMKDETTHWHIVLYYDPQYEEKIKNIIRNHFDWADAACDFIIGDPSKGQFASYCMKYTLKSVRGEATRIDAWYSIWNIRRFQFFGIPTLTTWRQLRLMSEAPKGVREASLWRACKRGDAATFINENGGLSCKMKDRPNKISVDTESFDDKKIVTLYRFGKPIQILTRIKMHLHGKCGRMNKTKRVEGTYSEIIQESQNPKIPITKPRQKPPFVWAEKRNPREKPNKYLNDFINMLVC